MQAVKRRKWLSGCALISLLLFLAMSLYCVWGQESAPSGPIEVKSAEWIELSSVSGTSDAVITDSGHVDAHLATLLMPGAYGVLKIEVINQGNSSARLTFADYTAPDEDIFRIFFSELPTDGSEILLPGECCSFSVVVQWDPECRQTEVNADADFGISLVYEEDQAIISPTDPNEPSVPQTGDITLLISLLGAIGSTGLLVFLQRRRKQAEK